MERGALRGMACLRPPRDDNHEVSLTMPFGTSVSAGRRQRHRCTDGLQSEGGMMQLETLMELKVVDSSFSSLSSYY